jgi:hypothetical protein
MKNRTLQLRRALSAALFVLLLSVTGMPKMYAQNPSTTYEITATANPSEGGRVVMGTDGEILLSESFDDYTVGNKIAASAIAAGHDWWTTWSNAPGGSEDGVVADFNGTQCGHLTYGNDQLFLFGDEENGVYDLEFDILVPESKNGYFNILHHFAGSSSTWAMHCYLHLTNDGYNSTSSPGYGTIHAGSLATADIACFYDAWMHFRLNIDIDTDTARFLYTAPGEEEILICEWQWSLDSYGNNTVGRTLGAIDFYPSENASTSEYYVDNISFRKIGGESAPALNIIPASAQVTLGVDDSTNVNIIVNNEGNSIGEWNGWLDFGEGGAGSETVDFYYHNGEEGRAIGNSSAFTSEIGMRMPVSAYAGTSMGMKIVSAEYFVGTQYQAADHNYTFRIYGQGQNNQPGELLAEKTVYSMDVGTWITATFDTSVYMTGQTIWATVELEQVAGEYPLSMDSGEYGLETDGNWLSNNGGRFYHCGFDGAWLITVNCEGKLIPATWATIDKTEGSIMGGQSDTISLSLNSNGLQQGTYSNRFIVYTNDEYMPYFEMPIVLNINNGLAVGTSYFNISPTSTNNVRNNRDTNRNSYTYEEGSTYNMTAIANPGYTFTNWTKEGLVVSTNSSISFTVTENVAYEAHFFRPCYVISATANLVEGGTITGGGTYNFGQSCTLTATANEGYTFLGWTEDGNTVSMEASYSFTVTGDRTLVANFMEGNACVITFNLYDSYGDGWNGNELVVSYGNGNSQQLTFSSGSSATYSFPFVNGSHITLGWISGSWIDECSFTVNYSNGNMIYHGTNLSSSFSSEFDVDCEGMPGISFAITAEANPAEGGTVTGDGIYDYGQTCTVTATANEGYTFMYWTEYNDYYGYDYVVSYDAEYSFYVDYSRDLVAHFALPFSITATASPAEGGTVTGDGIYDYGQTCTVAAMPNEGYCFYYWLEYGYVVSYDTNYSFVITDDHELVGVFGPPLSITAEANPIEGGTVSGGGVFDYGTTCTLTATPNPGYVFNNWTKNGSMVSCFSSLTINVTESAEYVANFQQTDGIVIGGAVSSSYNLPTYYYYSLTEQIYTASEMGGEATEISSVSFYDAGSYNMTRNMSVYMVNTDKTSFGSNTDWIPVTDADLVFGGSVTFATNNWTTIYFNTPFVYDGVSNVVLIVDDNSYSYNSYTSCRTFNTEENQALGIYSYSTDYDPYAPNSYSGTLMSEKNQVIFGIPSYEFSLTVSANPEEGGTVSGANGGLYYYGQPVNLVATPNEGYLFLNWSKNGEVVSCNATYSFTVTEDVDLEAVFMLLEGTLIGEGESTNYYLPSYSYYHYTLSQQIYTPEEIEGSGSITSISYYNAGGTKTRNYDIYLMHTDKHSFDSINDWIAVSETDRVYSGSVTMTNGYWTTIVFDTPFDYNGSSNLAIVIDDNTGSYTGSPYMACRVFDTDSNQAIRVYSDSPNYDPYNPTQYYGTLYMVKNQIILGFNNMIETNLSDEICYGEDYLDNGFEIYYPEVGENQYSITVPSVQGFDSIVNLTLTVYPTYYFAEDTTLCNATSYTWRGHTYTESGIYYDSLQTVHGCDSIFQLSLELFNTPLGEFASMAPTNNYPFTSLPITFSWDAVSGTEYYNLYLWNDNDPVPSTPFAGNIYNRSCYVSSLQNHQTYNWYVEVVNTCFSSTSSVRSFSLNIPPSMNVSTNSLAFGEVVLNDSVSMNMFVSGNALDDAITLQITGEDASMFSFEQGSNWNGLMGGSLTVTFSPTAVQYNYTANLVITTGTLTQTVQLTGSLADMFVFNTYVTQDVFEMNSTIPIYGTVMDINNNPMAGAEVDVKVKVMGTTRSLFATTGDDGHFSVEFVPANSESGYYTVNSGRVGHNSTAVHDDFNIPGMNLVTNGWILWDVVQNETTTGSIVIRNRSQIPLTNIQVTATNLPEGCSFTFQPLSLQGMEEGVLEYSVTGSALTSGNNYEEVRLVATSAEGATMNFSAWYYCAEPRGILYAAPDNITTTMTKDNSKIVDVMLYNNGTCPTGNVYLDLPSVDWLSVVGNDTLPSIAVHDSAYFSLRLSANENTPLVQYTGNIAINCERGDGLSLLYTITAVSDSTGTLVVDVTDDYTYNGNGQHLAGATVTVKGYYSLQTVAIGLTDSDGTFTVEDIPEGYYRMTITAPHHAEYQATIQIEGGQTNTQNIYLQYQAITYSWNVVPTEIEDEYTFELVVDYETNVPVPVVVIDMPQTFPELEEGESYVFDYIITNYGLVDTYDATLYPPEGHPLYDFTPLITEIDTLHAQSSVVIPCTMTVRTWQRSQAVSEALGRGGNREETECPYSALTQTKQCYTCGDKQNWFWANVWRIIGGYACEAVPYTPTPGAPAASGGGGSGGGGAASSSSSSPQIIIVHNNDCNSAPCLTDTKDTIDNCPDNGGGTPPALPPQNPANNR